MLEQVNQYRAGSGLVLLHQAAEEILCGGSHLCVRVTACSFARADASHRRVRLRSGQ